VACLAVVTSSDAYLELISTWPLLSLTIEVRRAARRREMDGRIKWKCGGVHVAVVTSQRRTAGHATALRPSTDAYLLTNLDGHKQHQSRTLFPGKNLLFNI
jgi:hypothetical protein